MKYIITNKQLFDSIYSYIDNIFNVEGNIRYDVAYDYTRSEETWDLVWFFVDGGENYVDEWSLEYTKDTWYTRKFDGKTREQKSTTNEWLPKTPLLSFHYESPIKSRLDGMFGDMWHSVFEQWFTDNFPDFPVKTFLYN